MRRIHRQAVADTMMASTEALFRGDVGPCKPGTNSGENIQPRNDKAIKPQWLFCHGTHAAAAGTAVIAHTDDHYAYNVLVKKPNVSYAARRTVFDATTDYTSEYNNWFSRHRMVSETTSQRQTLHDGLRIWEHERRMSTPGGTITAYGIGRSLKDAKNASDCAMLVLLRPKTQMDGDGPKESVQGLATQESDKASNTIVTRDEAQTTSETMAEEKATAYASSERITTMEQLTGRWMPLKSVEVRTDGQARDTILASYYLPETLFTQMGDAPNLLPFETFIYGKYDIEMKFVVNANKFQCGKLVAALKWDSYQADEIQTGSLTALQRPHVMLDLATNVEGVLRVPFRYHRAFVRNVKNDSASVGVRPSKFATVDLIVISPLKTGKDGQTNAFVRPFVRLTKAEFAGMSYRVAVQMDTLAPLLKEALPTREVRDVLGVAERLLKTIGETPNRDKPTVVGAQVFVPHPRLNFGTGKGLVDANPLRTNPYAMTSYGVTKPFEDDPKTTLDIARIWGLRSVFTWQSTAAPGTTIAQFLVDPSVRSYDKAYTGASTPLEYVCGLYQFWAGTIEIRLDFVSNAFHTGALMLAAEFGRPSDQTSESEAQTASTYTKTFHLGDQKSVHFTVPYIYDTVWRRCNNAVFTPIFDGFTPTDDMKKNALSIRADTKTTFRVRVVNDLRPVQTAPQDIEVLVFWRASPNFMVHSLKQSAYRPVREYTGTAPPMDNFPANYPAVQPSTRSKRSTSDYNEWNEKTVEARMRESARTQADTGDKEDTDPTEDFSIGKFNLALQTTDSQVSIKDILRRPVLMFERVTVKGYGSSSTRNSAFFIPLMPPSREMQFHSSVNDPIYSQLIGMTPQAAIMNMFRFWRGTMRYTIIVEGGSQILYVTHIPHSGVRITGNLALADQTSSTRRPIFGSGLATDILVPSINPTMVYEAPYDTENDWTLTMEEDAQRNYSWRDKGDGNAGHIALSSHDDLEVSVWWSAGDDFEVANFYGVPKSTSDSSTYLFNDTHARVQMDFITSNSAAIRDTILALTPSPIAALGTAYATYRGRNTLNAVDDTLRQGSRVLENLGNVVTRAENVLDSVTSQIHTAVATIINSLNVLPSIKTIIENSLFDLFAAYIDRSWTVVGMGICRVFYQVMGGTTAIMSFASQLATVIRRLFENTTMTQADDSHTYAGLLCALVGSALSVTLEASTVTQWAQEFGKLFLSSKGLSYMNNVLRFVATTFSCFKDLIMKALGYVDPEVAAVKALAENSTIINNFVQEAQICLNEANMSMLQTPAFRLRYWRTTMQAYQIQRSLVLAGRNVASAPLSRMCSDVIKAATERFVDLSCSPARYEPFVLCIEGDPGIGKSYITEKIVKALLDKIGFTSMRSGRTYTRAPGSKFWSGYRDQPAIIYDDWMNLRSSTLIEQTVSELYQLKSTTEFRPEMASIEEKRISANPVLVVLLCNGAFPSALDSGVASYPQAVLRRRDLVVRARLTKEFEERRAGAQSIRNCLTEEESLTMSHLEFDVARNATDKDSFTRNYKNCTEFVPWLAEYFEAYHRREQVNVKQRLQQVMDCFADNGGITQDPFELLYSAVPCMEYPNQNAYLPSEQLELAVRSLCATVENHMLPHTASENPVTQVGYGALLVAALKGVILTPSVVLSVASKSWTLVAQSLKNFTDANSVLEVGTCSVCFETDKELGLSCVNHTTEAPHSICTDCLTRSREHDIQMHRCPVCRSTRFGPAVNSNGSILMEIAIWLVKNVDGRLQDMVALMTRVLDVIPTKIINWINLLANITRYIFNPQDGYVYAFMSTAASEIADSLLRPDQDVWEQARALTQVDSPPFQTYEVPQSSLAREDVADIIEIPIFREDLWDTYKAPMRTTCQHEQLFVLPDVVAYEYDPEADESFFKLVGPSARAEYIYVPDGACCSTCPFGDIERVKSFMYTWRRRNIATLRRNITTAHNALGERRLAIKRKIPKLLRPTWLEAVPITVVPLTWWEYLSDVYAKHKLIINVCCGIVTATTALIGLRKLWSAWETPAIQGTDPNYSHEARQMRRIVQPRRIQPTRIQPSTQSESLDEIVTERIIRNYVIAKCYNEEGGIVGQAVCVGIAGKVAIMPRHYVRLFGSSDTKRITIEPALFVNGSVNHLRQDYTFDQADFTEMSNTDLAFFNLPNTYPSFRDIRNFFQTNDDAALPYPNEGNLVLVPTRLRSALMIKSVDIIDFVPRMKFEDSDTSTFWATDLLEYNHSEGGACGSILLTPNSQRPIRSMHVAGTSAGTGYGVLVTQELLAELPGERVMLQYEVVDRENIADRHDAMVFDHETRVDYLGALPKNMVPFSPDKTKIRPSLVAPYLEDATTAPAILSHKDKRYTHEKSPLYYGAQKHGKTTTDFTTTQVIAAQEAVWDTLINPMRPAVVKPKRLNIRDAIVGYNTVDYYEGIKLDTSSGFPWGKKADDSTKRAWITVDRDEHGEVTKCEVHPELQSELERKETLRKQGIVPETIFTDTLKDERKKLTKIPKQGSTRVFCACPVDYTIAMRQNYLHFCAAFMKARLNVNSAVGINAKGPEWTALYRKLTKVSPLNIVTMDYSNFGPAFNAKVSASAVELMVRWTLKNVEDVNELELRAILQECTNSVHAAGATVYRQFAGSPSGAPITTIINTLVNLLYLHISWEALAHQTALSEHPDIYDVFRKNVALVCYGDDFIASVSDKYKQIFNTNTIRNFLAQYKIAATSADKDLIDVPDFVPISHASFLKRTFRCHDTRSELVLGPLDSEALNEIPKWIWQCADKKTATRINVNSALMEAHAYGPKFFETYKQKLNDALARAKIDPVSPTWKTLDDMWFENSLTDNY